MPDAFKVHIAAELAVFVAVHADVDDDGAGLDHAGGEHLALAGGGHDHIGLAGEGGQAGRAAVADGDGGVGRQQHHGHGLAHDVAAADDDGVFAAQIE